MAENRVIGRDNALPWHLPDDLRRFKQLTMGHTLVVGRRTFASIGRALPGRRCIVLSRRPSLDVPSGVDHAHSFDAALAMAPNDDVYIAGGSEVYREALPRVDRLYVTLVHAVIAGDTTFPRLDESRWTLRAEVAHPSDARHAFAFTFRDYERVAQDD